MYIYLYAIQVWECKLMTVGDWERQQPMDVVPGGEADSGGPGPWLGLESGTQRDLWRPQPWLDAVR